MAVIKCKMCGGDLLLETGSTIAECEYCGSRQTVPVADNEKKLTLFARANRLRAACEFDKAAGIYETIVADFPEEAEAYWGLVLCRYGIEYVDDPGTGRKIPTCHRSSFDSLMEDSDFEQALENADSMARRVYREEAKQIEEIRKGIVAVSSNEEPYDIFICYKETDEFGNRTLDSVLAQDIYDALTGKGYRTFFARITLEDKLGLEYEPYIFAALNSAKIMLAVGTDYEYYNAVWVKNEWSRYLKLMTQDKQKHLIPCFKNLDAYDMPKEFARLQAQDLGKIGAMQDLLRGIEKILPKNPRVAPVVQIPASVNTSAMVMRGQFALEDGDFSKANEYYERALDQNPQDGAAYLGKVLAALRLSGPEQIDGMLTNLHDDKDFDRAIRFSDPATARMLTEIRERAHKKYLIKCVAVGLKKIRTQKEKQQVLKDRQYDQAVREMAGAKLESDFNIVAKKLEQLSGYKEADHYREVCIRKAEEIRLQRELKEQEKARLQQIENEKQLECARIRQRYAVRSARQCADAKEKFSVAIRTDGTVVAVGDGAFGRCDVESWRDIVSISVGKFHTVGLRANGTVVAVGDNRYNKCDVSRWRDIISVSAGDFGTVGLKRNGTCVAIGSDSFRYDHVQKWTDICAISAGACHTVGLKHDGTVVAAGDNTYGQLEVQNWTDIVAVSARYHHTLGLKADGTVVATEYLGPMEEYYNQSEVQDWHDILDISVGGLHSMGVKKDGTVVASKAVPGKINGHLQVTRWYNICAVFCGSLHTLGLKTDGTMVSCGNNEYGQCNVGGWSGLMLPPDAENMQQQLQHEIQQTARRNELYRQWDRQAQQRRTFRAENRCQHCGGAFKGLFSKKCTQCGKDKDY